MAAFTSIAAGVGMAVTAAGAVNSFSQAAKQKKLQNQAEQDAEAAMASARKKLQVNFYDQLSIQKEPYELQREALLSAGAQSVEAARESERGASAGAGRVQMAQNEAQAQIRTAEGQEMGALEKLSAQEDSRLRDVGVQLDLEEVAGAQLAARDAGQAATADTQQGFQGVESLAQQGTSLVPLYQKSQGAKAMSRFRGSYDAAAANPTTLNAMYKDASGKPLPFQQAAEIMGQQKDFGFSTTGTGVYDALKHQDYFSNQKPEYINAMTAQGWQ
jgi:hypothetical protein